MKASIAKNLKDQLRLIVRESKLWDVIGDMITNELEGGHIYIRFDDPENPCIIFYNQNSDLLCTADLAEVTIDIEEDEDQAEQIKAIEQFIGRLQAAIDKLKEKP
jgi:hypothetical protein